MPDPISAGGQTAAASLKSAQQAGKQLGAVFTDQQADMEKSVQEQHKQRLLAQKRKEHEQSIEEFRAFEKYEKNNYKDQLQTTSGRCLYSSRNLLATKG
jgi:uncharacterized protein YlxW (UPF0749 family)